MEKILLDTDIGGDIDDAICLAYLLKEPQCDLIGITSEYKSEKEIQIYKEQEIKAMQHECKITVLETKVFTEYQEKYIADPKSGH